MRHCNGPSQVEGRGSCGRLQRRNWTKLLKIVWPQQLRSRAPCTSSTAVVLALMQAPSFSRRASGWDRRWLRSALVKNHLDVELAVGVVVLYNTDPTRGLRNLDDHAQVRVGKVHDVMRAYQASDAVDDSGLAERVVTNGHQN